ncbi:MAG: glycosyltransferase family 4 protein [Anaerolineae bacterium]
MHCVHISKVTGVAGSERHLLSLLPGLAERGLRITMLVLEEPARPADDFVDALIEQGVTVQRVPIRSHLDARLPGELRRRLKRLQPDVVHTHLVHADFYGLPAAHQAGAALCISSRHNDNAFRRNLLFRAANRRVMRHTDRVIAISRALERFVADVEGIGPEKVVAIPYGMQPPIYPANIRTQARKALHLSPGAVVIGFVGRLIRQKGVDVLLQAVGHLPDVQVVIIGDGPLRAELEGTAGEHVRFVGWRHDARELMAAFDVLAVPSRWEGFGLVTLEAMSHALPVVAARVSALPEIVVDGETGLLVPAEDAASLAAALNTLVTDLDLARQMGQKGYQRLCHHFSEQAMIQSTYDVYTNKDGVV